MRITRPASRPYIGLAAAVIALPFLAACGKDSTSASAISDLYDGDRAKETVAYLDQFVRWPGNSGFNKSIAHVAEELAKAGYIEEKDAPADARLIYRVEEYPMAQPAWEPVNAVVTIEGESEPLLKFETNRNMLATNSFSTPEGGVTADLVWIGSGSTEEWEKAGNVKGKIVLADVQAGRVFQEAVAIHGAIGVLAYSLPTYLNPEVNTTSIQFTSVPRDTIAKSWGIALSYSARERLRTAIANGPVRVHVITESLFTEEAIERTVVAEVRGSSHADERFVFSAHVQEPGANDNASGVGAQMEMARVVATIYGGNNPAPARTLTMLWGLEIRSTDRYIKQDSVRAEGIRWGMSLDMVGEDTEKTGGTFLIEKMPDPSAIWTRGEDKHSEWGGRPLTKEDMRPHWFNDWVHQRALARAAVTNWVVNTNPFEGGSDHTPFLRADKPGLLLWHFTDQFYHTDSDRLDKVSSATLKNVAVTALTSALPLLSGTQETALAIVEDVIGAARKRIAAETALAVTNIAADPNAITLEQDILETWTQYYIDALSKVNDVELDGISEKTTQAVETAQNELKDLLASSLESLKN